jgi:hypothetical protein
MTIPKNTKKAKQAIANAHDIRCYSLSNNFSGEPLAENPGFYGGPVVDGRFTQWLRVSQSEFLAHELNEFRSAKLSENSNGSYSLHIHSNLWYEFSTHDFTLQPDDMLQCACGARRSL